MMLYGARLRDFLCLMLINAIKQQRMGVRNREELVKNLMVFDDSNYSSKCNRALAEMEGNWVSLVAAQLGVEIMWHREEAETFQ